MDGNREIHRVQTFHVGDCGYWWECDCGLGGSGPDQTQADVHSDRHIPVGAQRIDVHIAQDRID